MNNTSIPVAEEHWNSEDVLISLKSEHGNIDITIDQVCDGGTIILGDCGSGKTSGSLNTLQFAMMEKGFGMLNLCVNRAEADRCISLAHRAGRTNDVVRIWAGGEVRINFLEVLEQLGSNSDTVCAFFSVINEALHLPPWCLGTKHHLNWVIRLLSLAERNLDVSEIVRLISLLDAEPKTGEVQTLLNNAAVPSQALSLLSYYFCNQWPNISKVTRTSISESLKAALRPLCAGPLKTLFCSDTTFNPRQIRNGAIVIVDVPCIGPDHKIGVVSQILMKDLVQLSLETNPLGRSEYSMTRPCIIVADDCHYVLSQRDAEFISFSRSLRCGLLYTARNVDEFQFNPHSVCLLHGLRGIRILHHSTHRETIKWFLAIGAQILTGHHLPKGSEFYDLSRGNGKPAEAYLTQAGRTFSKGRVATKVYFPQLDRQPKGNWLSGFLTVFEGKKKSQGVLQ